MDKNQVCIVRTKLKKDYVFDAIQHYGYQIVTPYKGNSLIPRIFREIWFRGKLPFREYWYNSVIRRSNANIFIIFDPLILPEFIQWIEKIHPNARIILSYENRADKTIRPNTVSDRIEKWSYDKDDCEKYSMKWSAPAYFREYQRHPNPNPAYDVLYVGRDKGRAEFLFRIEKELNSKGLKTYFHICADRSFLRFKKKYYKKLLTYDEYLDLLVNTRAILNIVPEGQKSVTQREMEAAFDGIKCITNNKGILDFELYDPSMYFVLGNDNPDKLNDFLDQEKRIISREDLSRFDFSQRIQQMITE